MNVFELPGEYVQTGGWGVQEGQHKDKFLSPWQQHLGADPGLCWWAEYVTEPLEHGIRQLGYGHRARRGALWQPWGPQWLEWGIRDPGQPLTQLLKGWLKDIHHLLCSLVGCYWRSWVQSYFFFLQYLQLCYECRWSIKNLPPWVSMILGFSGLRITLIAFFYLTVSISGKVVSLAMLFSSSLSWLILFFSNLLTKIQYFHHFSLFPSGALTPSFWFWLSVRVVLGVQRQVQVLVCWVCLGSRELACGKCSVAIRRFLIKVCRVHCFYPHSETYSLSFIL